jgi:hypothetical protein
MQNVFEFRPASPQAASVGWPAPDGASFPLQTQIAPQYRTDDEFFAMLNAYRGSGGLARAQEVFVLFKLCCRSDVATLARWIVKRKVISFDWQSKIWLPLFQFNRSDMTPQPGLSHVLGELGAVFDPWETANWFAKPNAWIADRTPADTLQRDVSAVLNAARADRFIAAG